MHDLCLQNLPVTIAMDRAGLVGRMDRRITACSISLPCAIFPI